MLTFAVEIIDNNVYETDIDDTLVGWGDDCHSADKD
jgi:hypothetical protein